MQHPENHLTKHALSINIQKDFGVLTEWSDPAQYSKDLNSTTSSKQKEKLPFIFDDVAWHFNWITFFRQLFVHIIPFGFLTVNYSAQAFFPNNIHYFVLQIFSVIWVYLIVIAFIMCRDDEQNVISQGCYLPVVLFLLHKTTVSLKYACLSPTEVKRINREKNQVVSDDYQLQMQLLTGWLSQRCDVLQFELGAAAVRVGAKINEMYFTVPNPNSSSFMRNQFIIWNNLLRCDSTTITVAPATVVNHDRTDDDTESKSPALAEMEIQVVEQLKLQPDGSYIVSVYDTVMAIIKLAARDRFAVITMTELQWISKVVVYMFISVPFLEMIYANQPLSFYSGWFYVYLILATYTTFAYGIIHCYLLYCVVFDVRRQETMHTLLRAMIRLTDLDPESREILEGVDSDAPNRLARDNVCALFSISRDLKNSLNIKGTNPLHRADSSALDASKEMLVPQLCINHSENILCWVYARLVLQNFGLRFRHRMDLVAASLDATISFILCYEFINIYILIAGTIIVNSLIVLIQFLMVLLTPNNPALAFSCGFIQMLLSITVSLLCVIALFSAGAAVNDAYAQHKNALAAQSLRIRNHTATLRRLRATKEFEMRYNQDEDEDEETIASISADIFKCEQATQLLDSCQGMLAVSNSQGAFKVMGITAESSIPQYILSSAVSFLVTYLAVALPSLRKVLLSSPAV